MGQVRVDKLAQSAESFILYGSTGLGLSRPKHDPLNTVNTQFNTFIGPHQNKPA